MLATHIFNTQLMKYLITIVICSFGLNSFSQQIITTIAGDGTSFIFSGDGGPGTAAGIHIPTGLTTDDTGNVYICTQSRIRKVDTFGIITTFAGGGTGGDGSHATAALLGGSGVICRDDTGNTYVTAGAKICKINTAHIVSTIAGTGISGYSGDGGSATSALMIRPGALARDISGNFYISQALRIRKIDMAGIINLFAGNNTYGYSGDGGPATAAAINGSGGICTDNLGNIYFADMDNNVIRKISNEGTISTFAGTGVAGYSGDGGAATAATFRHIHDVTFDIWGNMYFTDGYNSCVRKIDRNGIVSTIAGNGTGGFSGDGGPALLAQLSGPTYIAVDKKGNIYVSDHGNRRVRRISTYNRAPWFVHGSTVAAVYCEGSNAIDTLMRANDSNINQMLNWSLLVPPTNGTVSATYSTLSTGTTLTPSGTTYTPDAGYVGADSFTVIVSDGSLSDTLTIFVTVIPTPVAAPITGADTLCVGNTTTLSAPTTGGIWSSTTTTVTVGSTTGTVTSIAIGTAIITYSYSNACGTATATHTLTILPAADCPTGTATLPQGKGYGIVPNPTSGSMTIVQPTPQPATIVVRSPDGRQQLSVHAITATTPISVSHLPAGIYIIQIITATSQWVGKVVVE